MLRGTRFPLALQNPYQQVLLLSKDLICDHYQAGFDVEAISGNSLLKAIEYLQRQPKGRHSAVYGSGAGNRWRLRQTARQDRIVR